MNIIAERITQRRKELGMTQRELAEKLNVSDKTVSRWETGKQIPDALMIPEIAMALSMCIDELYGVGTEKEQVAVQNMQARNHAYDLFKWMGFAILVVVAILSVGLPLLKHVLFRGHGSITVIILITVILILIVHDDPPECFCGDTAASVYPGCQDLSLGLNRILTSRPENTAAVMPPAEAFSPPVKIPGNPSVSTAFLTPSARRLPKPVNGTVAPAPANSAKAS